MILNYFRLCFLTITFVRPAYVNFSERHRPSFVLKYFLVPENDTHLQLDRFVLVQHAIYLVSMFHDCHLTPLVSNISFSGIYILRCFISI